ncbi:acrylyl-CoA reductase family protein [Paenibacillus azoreducens]|uniref:Quinone oxidoreductase YhfP n=1 Tax=Paenibacillus azoreducens TaxID=116718 RepID=A0A919YKA8_9BACL|nr:acryloyl-CoA reductase [Paenibacillus azoreducens]GIO49852.1 putative quinone oxidoreductase YhfP [Paenibacillus azoreducens]
MEQFLAYMVRRDGAELTGQIEKRTLDDLPEGDVLVKVLYSGVNYKDGLAVSPEGKVVKDYPIVPGIDLAGEVAKSDHPDFREGDLVVCTGYGLGVSHDGGFSEYARIPADWLLPLPEGLNPREAMGIGTAGFTAALSVDRLLHSGVSPEFGPVLVTGATGGVGSFAVDILSKAGYSVTASSGKLEQQKDWLLSLGAADVIGRDEIQAAIAGPLGKQRWAGVIDPVGGPHLAQLFKSIRYGGALALSGLTGGTGFEGTVFPFILRGVELLGIDSVYCPKERRQRIWSKLGRDWKPERALAKGIHEAALQDLPEVLETILQGKAVGRTVIRLA